MYASKKTVLKGNLKREGVTIQEWRRTHNEANGLLYGVRRKGHPEVGRHPLKRKRFGTDKPYTERALEELNG